MSCGERGQATVEVAAMIPLIAILTLAVGQLLAAGAARDAARGAAQAAAMSQIQGRGEARGAARRAVPAWAKERISVTVEGTRVRVVLPPRAVLPGLAKVLTARATADGGPRR